jgi:hypothetical protein
MSNFANFASKRSSQNFVNDSPFKGCLYHPTVATVPALGNVDGTDEPRPRETRRHLCGAWWCC